MRITLIPLMLMIAAASYGQKKPTKKEAPPTQKEMEQMMKEAEAMMKEMSEEDKKMMESMGIKLPDMGKAAKNLNGISDKQLAEAWEDENRIVPKKDAARIAAIPAPVKDAAGIAAYIKNVHLKSNTLLPSESKTAADKIYGYIQTNKYNSDEAGSIAMGMWLYGKPQVALSLLGNICASDVSNTDNISNYAAMLSMQGGQHLAIPLLNNLNQKYKWNSTLLNNLGQAWFGLGDLEKAGKYLDSAIALYPYHPQANLTKAAIEESKGNTAKAIEHVKKSIRHAYSPQKEEKLKKLGYKLKYADLYLPFVRSGDPLELETVHRPDYPMSVVEANQLYPAWTEFIKECEMRILKLEKEIPELTAKTFTVTQNTAAQMMKDFRSGSMPVIAFVPFQSRQAMYGSKQSTEYFEKKMQELLVPNQIKKIKGLDSVRREHRFPPPEAPCTAHEQSKSELIRKLNSLQKRYDEEYLQELRHYLKEMGHWALFTSTDENMLKIISIQYQIEWLRKNIEFKPAFESIDHVYSFLCNEKEPEKKTYGKLQEFDYTDACNYKSVISIGGPITLKTNCTHTTWEFRSEFLDYTRTLNARDEYEKSTVVAKPKIGGNANIGPLKAGASFGSEITVNMNTEGIKDWNAVVKAEAKLGVGAKAGPVNAEATVSTALELELDQSGITSASFTNKAQIKAELDIPKVPGKEAEDKIVNKGIKKVTDVVTEGKGTSFEIGVQNRINLITGSNQRSGTGILSGISFK
jgi:tetratricopeptide (TPR) repeat protein